MEKFNRNNPPGALNHPPPPTHTDYLSLSASFAQSIANLHSFLFWILTGIKIRINVPEIVYLEAEKHLMEPFVHNWTKFNSNTGYVNDYDDSIQNQVMQVRASNRHKTVQFPLPSQTDPAISFKLWKSFIYSIIQRDDSFPPLACRRLSVTFHTTRAADSLSSATSRC